MRLLVVEDEPPLRASIDAALRGEGYAVDVCGDGQEALGLGREIPYDLAVVDLGLPVVDGLSVIRRLRAEGKRFPILILTARGRWQEKVEGLNSGADDYLVKPFHTEELFARIKALLRRASGNAEPVLRHGPIALDTNTRAVTVSGQSVTLTGYEYRLLEYLLMRPGRIVSKTELTEHLYDQDFDRDSNTIEVFVARLRRKLDPLGRNELIETLRGQGYRLGAR